MEIPKRKNKSYSMMVILYVLTYRFIKVSFPKGGFRDGKDGFVNASMDAFCKLITIAELCKSRLADENIDKDIK